MKKFIFFTIIAALCLFTAIINFIIVAFNHFFIRPLNVFFELWINNSKEFIFYLPQEIREILNVYDNYGLKHNNEYLNKIKNEILDYPIEKQADCADEHVVFFSTKMFSIQYMETENNELLSAPIHLLHKTYNATTVGNLAFIALHGTNEVEQSMAKSQLQKLIDYSKTFK